MEMRMKTVRMRMRMRRMRIRTARMSSTLPCLHNRGRVWTAVTPVAAIQGAVSPRTTKHKGAAAHQPHRGAAVSYAHQSGGAATAYGVAPRHLPSHLPGADASPTPGLALAPPHLPPHLLPAPGPPTGGFGVSHSEAELAHLQLSLGKNQNMPSKSLNMSKSKIRTKRAAVVTIAAGTGAYYAKVIASALR